MLVACGVSIGWVNSRAADDGLYIHGDLLKLEEKAANGKNDSAISPRNRCCREGLTVVYRKKSLS